MALLCQYLVYDSNTQTVTVQRGPLAGMQKYGPFHVRDFDLAMGKFEPEETKAIMHHCRQGMTVFDIGANAGYHTLLFAKLVDKTGHVYAFEPVPENVQYLRETLRLNRLDNVTLHAVAVSDAEGTADMKYVGAFDGYGHLAEGGHGYYHSAPCQVVSVPTITLDKFCRDACISQVDLIKLDIEGAEILALNGMSQLVRTCHPILIIEFWGSENILRGSHMLHTLGYQVERLSSWSGYVRSTWAELQTVLAAPR
jgi:FkbM family methyltransferase